jgi:hypothetical protein
MLLVYIIMLGGGKPNQWRFLQWSMTTDLYFVFRVEYDDGDMGWVPDLKDGMKVKFVENSGSEASALMAAVATTVDVHAGGSRADLGADAEATPKKHRDRAASFSDAKPDVVPRFAEDTR